MSADTSAGAVIDVVVPTLRRPEHLRRCLDALAAQTLPPRRVVVVHRRDDHATAALLSSRADPHVLAVEVDGPGVNLALRAGVATTEAPIVAFVDDDAVAPPDWLRRIAAALSDGTVAAVGGRDRIPGHQPSDGVTVGRWTLGGMRPVGNHHRGKGPPRSVDFLKGVNMAYRADSLWLPRGELLRSTGAQPGFELVMGAAATSTGRSVRYDPTLAVEHDAAPRDGIPRSEIDPAAVEDDAANHVLARTLRSRRLGAATAVFLVLIGTRATPGLLASASGLLVGEPGVGGRFAATVRGVVAGLGTFVDPWRAVVSAAELRTGLVGVPPPR